MRCGGALKPPNRYRLSGGAIAMPVSSIHKRVLEKEKALPTAELIARWQGRRDSALAWAEECQRHVTQLCQGSQLEMDVVVEAPAPLEGGSESFPGSA